MKKIWYLLAVCLFGTACLTPSQQAESSSPAAQQASTRIFPPALEKVLDAHGGLASWQSKRSLSYTLLKESGNEAHHIDLWDRRDRIEGPNFTMGYDGSAVWLTADTSYKGNAVFYHNLVFYFYAMPFVLADEGIVYSEVEPLTFEDRSYPGIKISYAPGVGASDQDEYILYYDPETFQMTWLGYTATYFSGEKSTNFSYIRYNDWGDFEGIKLPNSISWYQKEEGQLTQPRRKREFVDIKLSDASLPDETYAMPEGALVVK